MTTNEPTLALSLTVKDGAAALDFYAKAFGAKELFRMPLPDGSIAHAELTIGNSHMYLSEEDPEWHAFALPEGTKAPCLFGITVEDCDSEFAKAVEAGCEALSQPKDQYWGMRTGMVLDPFGYRWNIRQLVEVVSPEEMMKRTQALISDSES